MVPSAIKIVSGISTVFGIVGLVVYLVMYVVGDYTSKNQWPETTIKTLKEHNVNVEVLKTLKPDERVKYLKEQYELSNNIIKTISKDGRQGGKILLTVSCLAILLAFIALITSLILDSGKNASSSKQPVAETTTNKEWVCDFEYSSLFFHDKVSGPDVFQFYLFSNNTNSPLDTIEYTHYGPEGLANFEIEARRIDKKQRNLLLSALALNDKSVSIDHYRNLIDNYNNIGTETGYLYRDNENTENNKLRGEIYLYGNGTTPRIGPLKAPINPGESIIIFVRVQSKRESSPSEMVEPSFGRRFRYDTKYLAMAVEIDNNIRLNQNTVRLEYRKETGSTFSNVEGQFSFINENTIFYRFTDLKDAQKLQIHWAWLDN